MEHKHIIIILGISIAIVAVLVFLSFKINLVKSPGTCQTITKNEGNNKIDIVFLTQGVGLDKVKEFADYLVSMDPFSSNKEKFNFYYAGDTQDCEVVQGNVLLCYSSALLRQASACPDDYVVVLTSKIGSVRSSAYTNVISLNVNLPKNVIRHEFGHVFGNLADEYVPSDIPRGSENCQKTCDFPVKDGCFQGCSQSSYYRSSQDSIMKTLAVSDYKTLNNQLMLEKLENMLKQTIYMLIAILIAAGSIAQSSQDVVLIQFHYENGNFSIMNKSLVQGSYPTISHESGFDYSVNLVSTSDNQLYSFSFDPTILFSDEQTQNGLDGGVIVLNESEFIIAVPSSSDGQKITLLKNGEKILEEEVYDVGASPCRIR